MAMESYACLINTEWLLLCSEVSDKEQREVVRNDNRIGAPQVSSQCLSKAILKRRKLQGGGGVGGLPYGTDRDARRKF